MPPWAVRMAAVCLSRAHASPFFSFWTSEEGKEWRGETYLCGEQMGQRRSEPTTETGCMSSKTVVFIPLWLAAAVEGLLSAGVSFASGWTRSARLRLSLKSLLRTGHRTERLPPARLPPLPASPRPPAPCDRVGGPLVVPSPLAPARQAPLRRSSMLAAATIVGRSVRLTARPLRCLCPPTRWSHASIAGARPLRSPNQLRVTPQAGAAPGRESGHAQCTRGAGRSQIDVQIKMPIGIPSQTFPGPETVEMSPRAVSGLRELDVDRPRDVARRAAKEASQNGSMAPAVVGAMATSVRAGCALGQFRRSAAPLLSSSSSPAPSPASSSPRRTTRRAAAATPARKNRLACNSMFADSDAFGELLISEEQVVIGIGSQVKVTCEVRVFHVSGCGPEGTSTAPDRAHACKLSFPHENPCSFARVRDSRNGFTRCLLRREVCARLDAKR